MKSFLTHFLNVALILTSTPMTALSQTAIYHRKLSNSGDGASLFSLASSDQSSPAAYIYRKDSSGNYQIKNPYSNPSDSTTMVSILQFDVRPSTTPNQYEIIALGSNNLFYYSSDSGDTWKHPGINNNVPIVDLKFDGKSTSPLKITGHRKEATSNVELSLSLPNIDSAGPFTEDTAHSMKTMDMAFSRSATDSSDKSKYGIVTSTNGKIEIKKQDDITLGYDSGTLKGDLSSLSSITSSSNLDLLVFPKGSKDYVFVRDLDAKKTYYIQADNRPIEVPDLNEADSFNFSSNGEKIVLVKDGIITEIRPSEVFSDGTTGDENCKKVLTDINSVYSDNNKNEYFNFLLTDSSSFPDSNEEFEKAKDDLNKSLEEFEKNDEAYNEKAEKVLSDKHVEKEKKSFYAAMGLGGISSLGLLSIIHASISYSLLKGAAAANPRLISEAVSRQLAAAKRRTTMDFTTLIMFGISIFVIFHGSILTTDFKKESAKKLKEEQEAIKDHCVYSKPSTADNQAQNIRLLMLISLLHYHKIDGLNNIHKKLYTMYLATGIALAVMALKSIATSKNYAKRQFMTFIASPIGLAVVLLVLASSIKNSQDEVKEYREKISKNLCHLKMFHEQLVKTTVTDPDNYELYKFDPHLLGLKEGSELYSTIYATSIFDGKETCERLTK